MEQKRLAEIKARYEAATAGPWKYLCDTSNRGHILYGDPERDLVYCPSCSRSYGAQFIGTKDGPFVAHAHQDIPDMHAEIERLTKNLDSQIRANRIHAGDICSANNEADDLREEVERLQALVKTAHREGFAAIEGFAKYDANGDLWTLSEARKELEAK